MTRTRVVNIRQEPYDVYIGRPSIYGNPYRLRCEADREDVVRRFRTYFYGRLARDPWFRRRVLAIKGRSLGCHCRPKRPCHGDVIAAWVDAQP